MGGKEEKLREKPVEKPREKPREKPVERLREKPVEKKDRILKNSETFSRKIKNHNVYTPILILDHCCN